jgi:aerobic-type carbon monoxide dehydrogenase small subunit (CoxS/CutS family)
MRPIWARRRDAAAFHLGTPRALNGAKFGCGLAQWGACTVQIDGRAARSCVSQIGALGDAEIITIEGSAPSTSHTRFSAPSARGTPIRRPLALF